LDICQWLFGVNYDRFAKQQANAHAQLSSNQSNRKNDEEESSI